MRIEVIRTFIVVLVSLIPTSSLKAIESQPVKVSEQDEEARCPLANIIASQRSYGHYKILVKRDEDFVCQTLEIRKSGLTVYTENDFSNQYEFGRSDRPKIDAFGNITGKSKRTLVISNFTGGAHCCFSILVFELEPRFRKVATIEGGDSYPKLKDFDRDGVPEIIVQDNTFAYLFSSFAESASGEVVLKFNGENIRN